MTDRNHRVHGKRRTDGHRTYETVRSRKQESTRRYTSRRHRKSGASLVFAYVIRILFLTVILAGVAFTVRGISGILSSKPMEKKTAEATAPSLEILSETTEEATEVSEAETEPAPSNLIESNGRTLDLTKPMIALTFDDGPYPEVGNVIMDEMAKVGGKATFFVVGTRVPTYKTEVQRMVAEGHEIANHSYDHDESLSKKGVEYVTSEFQRCNSIVEEVSGIRPTLIRLPGGIISDAVKKGVPCPMFHWSVDTRDWKTRNAQATIDSVVGHVRDGDIVLMHELYTSTAEACRTIIPTLAEQGFQLVTVSELYNLKAGDVNLKLDRQYTDFRPETVAKLRAEQAASTPTTAAAPETAASEAAPAESAAAVETVVNDAASSAPSESTVIISTTAAADGPAAEASQADAPGAKMPTYAYSGNTSIKLYGSN